ncbi:MAG: hypothetical protein II278_06190 [Bacteroidaceae bacterium]|nr:hypothetical protein [Bacteroidaceae bacterium]
MILRIFTYYITLKYTPKVYQRKLEPPKVYGSSKFKILYTNAALTGCRAAITAGVSS